MVDDSQKGQEGGAPVERVSIPQEFYRLNKFVTIPTDLMFVSGVHFFEEDKVHDSGISPSTQHC